MAAIVPATRSSHRRDRRGRADALWVVLIAACLFILCVQPALAVDVDLTADTTASEPSVEPAVEPSAEPAVEPSVESDDELAPAAVAGSSGSEAPAVPAEPDAAGQSAAGDDAVIESTSPEVEVEGLFKGTSQTLQGSDVADSEESSGRGLSIDDEPLSMSVMSEGAPGSEGSFGTLSYSEPLPGVYLFEGTDDADQIDVEYLSGTDQIRVTVNGAADDISLSAGNSLTILAGDGDDVITVKSMTPTMLALFAIDGGSGDDTLACDVDDSLWPNVWTMTDLGVGLLKPGSGFPAVYTSIEHLVGGPGIDVFAMDGGGSVSGSIDSGGGSTSVDIGRFAHISGEVSFSVDSVGVTYGGASSGTLGGVTMLQMGFRSASPGDRAFIGVNGGTSSEVGFESTDFEIAVAVFFKKDADGSGNDAVWLVLKGELDATFKGPEGLVLTATALKLSMNEALVLAGNPFADTWLDLLAFALEDDGDFSDIFSVDTGDGSPIVGEASDAESGRRASSDLVEFNLFDVVQGRAHVALKVRTVDADTNGDGTLDLDDASLISLALTGLSTEVGASGIGVGTSSGDIGLALLIPFAAIGMTGVADPRAWVGANGRNIAGALTLGDVLTAEASDVSFRVNEKTEAASHYLDWMAAIDLDPEGDFEPGDTVDPGEFLDTPVDLTISSTAYELRLEGDLTELSVLFGFVNGSAHFELDREIVDVDVDGDGSIGVGDVDDGILFKLGLSVLDVWAGIVGYGVKVSSGTIAVASIVPNTASADTRQWLVLQGDGLGGNLDLGAVASATVSDVSVVANWASDGAPRINWTTGSSSGTPPRVDLDEGGAFVVTGVPGFAVTEDELYRIEGELVALSALGGMVSGSGHFFLSASVVALDLDGDGDFETSGAILTGIEVSSGAFELGGGLGVTGSADALAIATLARSEIHDYEWYAIIASGVGATLDLAPVVAGELSAGSLRYNGKAASAAAYLDWNSAADL
ncbi:MAG: hypothetical protein ACNA76_07980, partial [Anaerosomatales bacterium]